MALSKEHSSLGSSTAAPTRPSLCLSSGTREEELLFQGLLVTGSMMRRGHCMCTASTHAGMIPALSHEQVAFLALAWESPCNISVTQTNVLEVYENLRP